MMGPRIINRMKIGYFLFLFLIAPLFVTGQKYTAEKSSITFYSDAAIEDIKAVNSKGSSMINTSTGEIVFSIPIKEFEFEKALMQEHFNEKYLESDKYPKAIFTGQLNGLIYQQSGEQQVIARGRLTIHGVTQEIEVPGKIELRDGRIYAQANFIIRLENYRIKIPQLLWQNIAEEVEVTIDFTYKPL